MEKENPIIVEIDKAIKENPKGMPEELISALAQYIPDDETLAAILPQIKELYGSYKQQMEDCDSKARTFSEGKKICKMYCEQVAAIIGKALDNLGHSSYSSGDAKATIRNTEVLECDDEKLLQQYIESDEYELLTAKLPGWIKITLTIDKTTLKRHIKVDNTLLKTHPEWIHTKQNKSVTLN